MRGQEVLRRNTRQPVAVALGYRVSGARESLRVNGVREPLRVNGVREPLRVNGAREPLRVRGTRVQPRSAVHGYSPGQMLTWRSPRSTAGTNSQAW